MREATANCSKSNVKEKQLAPHKILLSPSSQKNLRFLSHPTKQPNKTQALTKRKQILMRNRERSKNRKRRLVLQPLSWIFYHLGSLKIVLTHDAYLLQGELKDKVIQLSSSLFLLFLLWLFAPFWLFLWLNALFLCSFLLWLNHFFVKLLLNLWRVGNFTHEALLSSEDLALQVDGTALLWVIFFVQGVVTLQDMPGVDLFVAFLLDVED